MTAVYGDTTLCEVAMYIMPLIFMHFLWMRIKETFHFSKLSNFLKSQRKTFLSSCLKTITIIIN